MLAQDMPIYKQTFDFVCAFEGVFAKMPKLHRFPLGAKIYESSLDLFEFIENYNRAYGDKARRIEYISGYLVKLNTIETLIRLSVHARAISFKQQAVLNKITVQLGRQAVALKSRIAGENV